MVGFDHEKLKRLRKENHLTQEQLAEMAEISDRYLRAMESNRAVPSCTVLFQISRALNTTMDDFMRIT